MQTAFRKEDAWHTLPFKTRLQLYTLLPEPRDGEPAHDPDVHPLKSVYKSYIEEELRRWQEDLKDGRESKKWREEAMQAGKDRAEGKFDEWKELEREQYWGKKMVQDENAEVKDEEVVEVKDSQGEDEAES